MGMSSPANNSADSMMFEMSQPVFSVAPPEKVCDNEGEEHCFAYCLVLCLSLMMEIWSYVYVCGFSFPS